MVIELKFYIEGSLGYLFYWDECMFFTSRKQPIRCISMGQTAVAMSIVRPLYTLVGAALLQHHALDDAIMYAFLGGFLNGICFGFFRSKISQDMETLDEPLPTFMLIQLCLAVAGITSIPLGCFVTRKNDHPNMLELMVLEQILGEYAISFGFFIIGLLRMLLMRHAQEHLTISQLIWRYWSFNIDERVLCPVPPPLYVEASFIVDVPVVVDVTPVTHHNEAVGLPNAHKI